MGFYGNISSVNKSTFQFDKIYSNRAEMEDSCKDDGIFIGRYVLVDYDQELSAASILSTLRNDGTLGEEALGLVGYQVKIKSTNQDTQQEDIIDPGKHVIIASGLSRDRDYTLDNSRIKNALDESKDVYCVVLGNLIGQQKVGTAEYEYSLKSDITPLLYKASIGTETVKNDQDQDVEQQYLEWTLTKDLDDLNIKANSYLANYRVDEARFPDLGRGWDSTVWQKTYKNNEAAYVMIAELNSVVPTFDVTVDAPTEVPLKPHYDTDTSNVYYRLHVQPSWGMRVRASDGSFSFDSKKYPSDVKGSFIIDQKLIDNHARPRESGYYPDNIWTDSHILEQKVVNKDLAIYFNKAGFDKKFPHLSESSDDIINMMPTGYSTNKYYSHKIEDENGNTIREEGLVAQQYPDTYELSIVLPSIGNTISKIWDIVYGEGAVYDALGKFLWDKETNKFAAEEEYIKNQENNKWIVSEEPVLMRNTAIEWNTNTGIRMNKGIKLNFNEETGKNDKEIITYNKEALNSMAGIINTVHDLMGMIIIERENTSLEPEAVTTWDPEKIYYIDGKYYYKARAYNFENYTAGDGIPGNKIIDVTDGGDPVITHNDEDDSDIITTRYFRQSEEMYDNYYATKENEEGKEESYLDSSAYFDYYKVDEDYANILEDAIYGTLKLKHLPNLSFENYSNAETDVDGKDLYYYKEIKDNQGKVTDKVYVLADVKNAEKTPVNNVSYYKMKFEPVTANELEYYYVPDVYWLGIKKFKTSRELNNWNAKTTFEDGDFDFLSPCAEKDIDTALGINGIHLDEDNNIIENKGENVTTFIGYKFLLGVQLNPSKSTYVLRDENIKNEEYTQINQDDNWITAQSGPDEGTVYEISITVDADGKIVTNNTEDSTNNNHTITEILQNVEISTVAGENNVSLLHYKYKAAQYYNTKNVDAEGKVKTDEENIKTLLEWKQWVENPNNNIKELDLIRATKLVRVISDPVYTIQNAKIISGFTLKPDENTGDIDYYYHPGYSIINGRSANDIYKRENIADLTKEQGRTRIELGQYFKITSQSESFVYFDPQENYYYKDDFGNYLKENNAALKESGQTLAITYYKLMQFIKLDDGYNIFIPNMYREVQLDANGKPVLDTNGNIISTPIENYDDIRGNKKYQVYEDLYIKPGENGAPADKNEIFAAGAKWNMNVTSIPKAQDGSNALTLSRKTNTWEARELKDFGNVLNTINGLIVRINQKLADGDMITRDQRTVQGAINTLNDIIAKFSILIPGEFAMVDTYGRVHSGDWDSKQKFSYSNIGNPNAGSDIPDGEPVAADNERWLKLTTTSGEATDFKPHIKLEHTFNAVADTTTTANKNIATGTGLNKGIGDTLSLYTPIVDNTGHVVGKNTETVTLPYGFKTISTNGRNSNNNKIALAAQDDIIADNTQDTLGINSGNEWIKIETNPSTDVITISHDVKNVSSSESSLNLSTEISGTTTFDIPTYTFDATNHYSSHDTKTLTMPNSYGKFTGDTGSSEATATHDTFSITGDTWVTTAASADQISLAHSAPHEKAHATVANETPNFGSTFTIKDLDFDNKGHKANEGTHTVTIPQSSLVTDGLGNVMTGLSLVPSTGVFTQNRALVGSLDLTGYNANETNPLITASDTINGAFKKIETVLDNSNTTVNTRINNFKGTSADVNDSTVYGIVNSSKNSLIGNIGDSWNGATPAYTLYGLKDYIDQAVADQLNEGIRFSSHIWGVQAFYNSTENQVISVSDQNLDNAIVPVSILNEKSLTYGAINGNCEDYSLSSDNSNLTGIKVNESGLYRVQACAAVKTQSTASNLINGVKVWVMKINANGGSKEKIISITESLENSATSTLNATYATSSKLTQLNAGDVIYLAVTHVNSTGASINILADNDTYILLEKLDGELVQA